HHSRHHSALHPFPTRRSSDLGETPICFNLSHAGEIALYAVAAGREVGVDVESVRGDMAHVEIAANFFSRREVAALLALPAEARRSEEHTSELQSQSNLVCRLL